MSARFSSHVHAGQSSSLTAGSLGTYEAATSPGLTMHSPYTSVESDDDDEGMASPDYDAAEVQDIFTDLLEIFDASAPGSQQQQRAMNSLWSFYAAHADQLEACAPELEAMLSTRHASGAGQTPFARVSTSPSGFAQHYPRRSHITDPDRTTPPKWNLLHRRSRSMT